MALRLSLKSYQFLSLISGFLITLVFGSLYTLGTITPYIASYIYHSSDPSIKVVDVSILYPMFNISQVFGIFLSMIILQKYLSYRVISFIGVYGMIICVLITSICSTYTAFVFYYSVLYGFLVGCSYLIPMLNCYTYLPNRKGLCSGICMMAFGVGSLIFNQIFLKLINPDNLQPNQSHIFPQQVASNVPYAFRIISIVYFGIGSIGCILMIPKNTLKIHEINQINIKQSQKQHQNGLRESLITEAEIEKYIKQQQQSKSSKLYKENKKNQQEKENNKHQQEKENNKKQQTPITPFTQLLKTSEYKWLLFMIATSMPFGAFVAFNYKQYGQTLSKDDYLITLMGSLGAISNSFSRIFWGWVLDKWNFKSLILLLNTTQIIYMILIIFIKDQIIYMILILAIYFSYGANFGLYPAMTAKIYGEKDGGRIYSVVFIGFASAAVIQFMFHFFIVKNMGDQGFLICFIVFGCLLLIAEVLFIKINFKIKNDENNQKYSNNKIKN